MAQTSGEESDVPRRRSAVVVSAYVGTAATVIAAVTGLVVAIHGSSTSASYTTLAPAFRTTTTVAPSTTTSPTPSTTIAPSPPVSITGFGTGDPIVVQGTYTAIPTGYQISVFATNTSVAPSASRALAQPWDMFGPASATGGQWTERIPKSSAPSGSAVYRATFFEPQTICPSTQTSGTGPPLSCTGDPLAPLEQNGPKAKGTAGQSAPVTFVNSPP